MIGLEFQITGQRSLGRSLREARRAVRDWSNVHQTLAHQMRCNRLPVDTGEIRKRLQQRCKGGVDDRP